MPEKDTDITRGQQVSVVGMLVNVGLAFVKLLAGLVGHSYALIADSVESMADIVASAVVWHGLNVAARPADQEHPYGHGRAETLAALTVAVMIMGAGVGIAVGATRNLLSSTPHDVPALFTLWVLLGVVATKETMFHVMRRVSREVGSTAVLSDAWHQRGDAFTSAAAVIGIGIAVFGGQHYASADDWAALFAAGVILLNGARLTRGPVRELMDTQPTGIVGRAREVAETVGEVKAVEKVHARKSGMRYLVDMHIEVDPEMSVRRAHAVAHRVKSEIQAAIPTVLDVLVHVEPAGEP